MKRCFFQMSVLAGMVLLLGLFPGCGSDDGGGGETTGPGDESLKNPVAAGFKAISDAADARDHPELGGHVAFGAAVSRAQLRHESPRQGQHVAPSSMQRGQVQFGDA